MLRYRLSVSLFSTLDDTIDWIFSDPFLDFSFFLFTLQSIRDMLDRLELNKSRTVTVYIIPKGL